MDKYGIILNTSCQNNLPRPFACLFVIRKQNVIMQILFFINITKIMSISTGEDMAKHIPIRSISKIKETSIKK